MYDNAKEMAEDLALETQRANDWEAKYTELLAEYVQLLGEYGKIVRCKDCIYWCECKTKDKFPFKKDSCNKFGTKMNADDFCSRGERRDEQD